MSSRRAPRRVAKIVIKARAPRRLRGAAPQPRRVTQRVALTSMPQRARTTRALMSSGGVRTLANTSRVGPRQDISVGFHPTAGKTLRVTGTEYLGAVSMTGSEQVGTILAQYDNSVMAQRTALGVFSSLYSRWTPNKWRYVFRPSVPEGTTAGSFIMAQDPDPFTHYITGDADNVVRLRNLDGASIRSAWQTHTCDLPPARDYTSLWCVDPDIASTSEADRLDLAGRMYFAVAAKSGLAAGSTLGTLELEYDVHFYGRRLGATAITREINLCESPTASTMESIRSALKTGKTVLDTFISTIRPLLTSDVSADLEPLDDALRNYKTLYPPTSMGEAKILDGPSSNLGGLPPGKYNVQMVFWSPTVDLNATNWVQDWPMVYPSNADLYEYVEGPQVRLVSTAYVIRPVPILAGSIMPTAYALPFQAMMLSWQFSIKGRNRAFVDVAYPTGLKTTAEADVTCSLQISNASNGRVVFAPATGGALSARRGARARESKMIPPPLVRSDESDYDIEDYPYPARRNYPTGCGAGVPGSDDYRPTVAGAGAPAGVASPPSRTSSRK